MDSRLGGRRSVVRLDSRTPRYEVNLLRLGPAAVMAMGVGDCTLRSQGDPAGMIYVCRSGRATVNSGRKSIALTAGSIGCLVPGGDRDVRFAQGFSGIGIRVAPAMLQDCLDRHGQAPDGDWSRVFTSADASLPEAGVLLTFLDALVAEYGRPDGRPDRRADNLYGRSIAAHVAALLAALAHHAEKPRPSYVVAARAEDVILQRFAEPLTIVDLARETGTTTSTVRASMLRYLGLLPGEFLAYVRVLAVDEAVRRQIIPAAQAARRFGFVSGQAYRRAQARQEEFTSRLAGRRFQ